MAFGIEKKCKIKSICFSVLGSCLGLEMERGTAGFYILLCKSRTYFKMKQSKNINISISQKTPNQGSSNQWLWELLPNGNIYKKTEAIIVTKNFCETYSPFSLIFQADISWHGKIKKTKRIQGNRSWKEKSLKKKWTEMRIENSWYKREQVLESDGHWFKFWLLPCVFAQVVLSLWWTWYLLYRINVRSKWDIEWKDPTWCLRGQPLNKER